MADEKKTDVPEVVEDDLPEVEDLPIVEEDDPVVEAADEDKPQTPPETDDENKQRFGQRAEKRISKLVKARNELREQVQRLEAEKAELHKRYVGDASAAEEHAATQHEQRIEAEEKRLKAEFLAAEDEANADRKYEISRAMARLEAERLALNTWKAQRPQRPKPEEQQVQRPQPQPQARPRVDKTAQEWFQENRWFTVDQELTKTALEIDADLQREGFDPLEQPEPGQRYNDYYRELNAELRRRAPTKFQTKPSGTSTVAPGTRSSGRRAKQSVTLSASERQRARNLGISEELYAKEKLKLMQQRGEL